MIALRRLLPLALALFVLLFALQRRWGVPEALVDPSAFLWTLLLPWLALVLSDSFASATRTAQDLFRSTESLERVRVRASAARLASLGASSITAGVLVGAAATISIFNGLAVQGGNVEPASAVPTVMVGLALGPIYGLALKAFLYDPAAAALRAEGQEDGDWLGDD